MAVPNFEIIISLFRPYRLSNGGVFARLDLCGLRPLRLPVPGFRRGRW
jgi:hypothetical protein